MAEERIYITEVKEGDVCPFEEYCEGFSKLCKGCNVLPTRQEAIERMAKAICQRNHDVDKLCTKCECGENGFCFGCLEGYKRDAEAALNALLEEK